VSRSIWAWTESCVFVSTPMRGAGTLDTHEDQVRLGNEHGVRTVSSLTPLSWVAIAVMLTLAFSPAAALGKARRVHSRASLAPAAQGTSRAHRVTHPGSRSSDPLHAGRHSARDPNSHPELLAFGSGYSTNHGSNAVRALQRRLAGLGYSPGPIDGRYGPLTEQAVTRFQATHGLQVDGIAGPQTIGALASAKPVLHPGDGYVAGGSPLVRTLQRRLAAAGYPPGPIDGRFGPMTERAVTRFQTARHLQVDGIAGQQTLDRLETVLRRQVHHKPRSVTSRPGAAHHGSRPAPTRPSGGPSRTKPSSLASHRARRAAGSLSIAWIIVVACLLLAALAGLVWHRRRHRGGRLLASQAEVSGGSELEGAGRDLGPRQAMPDPPLSSVGNGQSAAESLAGEAEGHGEDHRDGAGAFRLASLLAQEGDHAGAQDALRRADERGHPEAAFMLGVLLAQQGDHAGAKEALRRADQRGHPDAAFDLGALLLQEGDRSAAEEAFRRSDERGDPGAACNLGVLLEQRGDRAAALDAYRRADKRGHGVGACNLGALLEQEGDVVGAKDAYRRADQRGDSAGAYRLGLLLEHDGDRVGAKEAYRRADQRGHPEAAYRLGLLLRQDGDHAEAIEAFRRAREKGSREVAVVAHAALMELGASGGVER
jgi:peptidoglycan hydrolase-like protein with peptidoglycan-binding domain/TPR repeat protein